MLVLKVMMSLVVMSMKLTKQSRVYTGGTWCVSGFLATQRGN